MTKSRQTARALELYRQAEQAVHAAGYSWEPEWQRARCLVGFTERDVLRESAWVILCSGFKESIVRNVFDYVSLCFCDWEDATEIAKRRHACIETASWRFGNRRKLNALAEIAVLVADSGFDSFRAVVETDPICELQKLPFIGPITSWHLAKNLGFNVTKNDRHLARLAEAYGYADSHELCRMIAKRTGEMESVVDLILWRFSVLNAQRQPVFHFS